MLWWRWQRSSEGGCSKIAEWSRERLDSVCNVHNFCSAELLYYFNSVKSGIVEIFSGLSRELEAWLIVGILSFVQQRTKRHNELMIVSERSLQRPPDLR